MADFTTAEYLERLAKLQQMMAEKDIPLTILNLNTDLYYYTGSIQPLYLVVPVHDKPFMIARKALDRISAEVPHFELEIFNSTQDIKEIIVKRQLDGVKRLGFTLDATAYTTVMRWIKFFDGAEIIDLSWDLRLLRMVKSEAEIAILARAGEIMANLLQQVKAVFKPGITDLEISAAVEYFFRKNGHSALVRCRSEQVEMNFGVCSAGVQALFGTKFNGVCAGTGMTAAVPYGAGNKQIIQGVPVVLDYAFNLAGYHIDQTRMFSWKKPVAKVLHAYQSMVEIEQAIMEKLKPGKNWSEIYDNAIKLAGKFGFTEEFMGIGNEKVRFVGHGVGLELDEPPFLAPKMEYPLQNGMVVAIEPKVALPGIGVIGIEDTLVIEDSGCKVLTSCPQDFIVIP